MPSLSKPRRNLTNAEKDAIIARQGGVCPGLPGFGVKCGKPVTRDTATFDHVDQRVFTKSDHIDEFQALCRGGRTSCDAIKTHGKPGAGSAGSDANKRAKLRRRRVRARGKTSRWPKGRKLQSRNNLRRRARP